MSRQETLSALTPFEVHAANSDTLFAYERNVPIKTCEGENVACIVTKIGEVWVGARVGELWFRDNRLVCVMKSLFWGPVPPGHQGDVDFARELHAAIAVLVSEHNVNCTLKATNKDQPGGLVSSSSISCGQRSITISSASFGVGGESEGAGTMLWETLGEVPKYIGRGK